MRRLADALRLRSLNVWVDWDDIPPSADWQARIYAGIDSAMSFVAVLSPDLVASEVCRDELGRAVQSQKRLIPVLRREVDRQAAPAELLVPKLDLFPRERRLRSLG